MTTGRGGIVIGRFSRRLAAVGTVVLVVLASLTTALSPAAQAAISPRLVGVNAVTLRFDDLRTQQYDAIQAAGFKAVRIHVEWPLIEEAPGQFTWDLTDSLVVNAVKRGLQILGVVTYTPSWAATREGRGYIHPHPADPNVFGNFTRIAAERYRGVIRNWEIWNEPNIVESFAPRPDVALYSAMLKNAYTALKSVDPLSFVVTGGTSPTIDSPTKMAPATFVRGLYENGAGDFFDAVGMHPYSVPELLSAPGQAWTSNTAIREVTAVMARNGQSRKQLWFTEFGAPTMTGHEYGVTEERQAQILVDGIKYMRSLPNCGPIFLFDHRDIRTGSSNFEHSFGLLRSDFTPKPSLGAVQPLLAGL